MSKKKKETPIYELDKYGLLYQVNKPLSENDERLLELIKKLSEDKKLNELIEILKTPKQ
jgi:hypothetical protein